MVLLVAVAAMMLTAGLLVTPYYMLAPFIGPAALGGLLILRYPILGFYAVVFLIPFGAYRRIGGDINLPWIAAAAALGAILLKMFLERKEMPALRSNLWPPFILYLGISAISALLSDYRDTSVENVILFAAAGGYIFLGLTCVGPEAWRRTLPYIVIGSVSLGSFLAAISFLFGIEGFTEQHNSGTLTRGVGGAIDPNNLCLMTLFTLPLVVHKAIYAQSPKMRLLMIALIPLNLMAIVSAFSRSGFLATVALAGLMAFHYRHLLLRQNIAVLGLAAILGMTSVVVAVPQSFWQRQISVLNFDADNSLSRRGSYLEVAKRAFPEAPLLGAGPGAFIDIYGFSPESRLYTGDPDRRRRRAHNTYIEVLIGTGLIGFAVWMWMQGRGILNFFRAERAYADAGDKESANLAASYRMGFLILLFFLMVFSELYHKYMLLALAMSQVALTYAPVREKASKSDERMADAKPAVA